MENQDIRWKQRFSNYEKAFKQLSEAINSYDENSLDIIKEGTIQRFEFTHELAWNVMKDFLTEDGIQDLFGSKSTTREAFNKNLIENGDQWMEMIKSRNLSVHTYHENILEEEYHKVKDIYFPLFVQFHEKMKTLL